MAVLSVGIGVVLLILLYGIFATLGTNVNEQFQTSSFMCTAGSWNSSSDRCENSTGGTTGATNSIAAATNLNVSSGLITAGQNTPTIASVGGFVIIIALLALVAAYAFGAFS